MHAVDLSAIDLNLLVALDALLTERNVTRAASRIGRTQPAMSHALGRLRELLGDPILVRSGRGMAPTPRALALAEPLAHALADLRRLLEEEGAFDARSSTRMFRLVCPDLLAAFLPELLGSMSADAPRVGLAVRSPGGDTVSALASADLALGPAGLEGSGLVRRGVGRVTWVVLARRDHPGVRTRLTLKRWCAYPHVQVRVTDAEPSILDRALAAAGVERRVSLHVPSFLLAPEIVARTDHFFTAPRELVAPIAERLSLRLHPVPIPVPELPVAVFWHERFQADPGHRWFREVVTERVSEALRRSSIRAP